MHFGDQPRRPPQPHRIGVLLREYGGDRALRTPRHRDPCPSASGSASPPSAAPATSTLGRDADLPAERSVEALRARAHELLDAAYAPGPALRRRGPLLRPGRGVPRGWLDARAASPTWSSAASGATPTRRTGGSTPRCTRSRTTASPRSNGSSPRPARCSATGSTSTRSTPSPPDSPALTDRALQARLAAAGGRRGRRRASHQRSRPGRGDPRGVAVTVDGQPLFCARAGDLEPAGALGRPGAGRGPRRRARGDRQGGHGQRPAGGPRPGRPREVAAAPAPARRGRPGRGPAPALGRRRALRRGHPRPARRQPRAAPSTWTRTQLARLAALAEGPRPTGGTAPGSPGASAPAAPGRRGPGRRRATGLRREGPPAWFPRASAGAGAASSSGASTSSSGASARPPLPGRADRPCLGRVVTSAAAARRASASAGDHVVLEAGGVPRHELSGTAARVAHYEDGSPPCDAPHLGTPPDTTARRGGASGRRTGECRARGSSRRRPSGRPAPPSPGGAPSPPGSPRCARGATPRPGRGRPRAPAMCRSGAAPRGPVPRASTRCGTSSSASVATASTYPSDRAPPAPRPPRPCPARPRAAPAASKGRTVEAYSTVTSRPSTAASAVSSIGPTATTTPGPALAQRPEPARRDGRAARLDCSLSRT